MWISAREAATVLGLSERAVRARLARGDLAGRKMDGRWVVARHALPVDAAQRANDDARATRVRDTVDQALAQRGARGVRSIADLTAFQVTRDVHAAAPSEVAADLRDAASWLAVAWHEFNPHPRLEALTLARAALARAAAGLLLATDPKSADLARRIEAEALPALVGLFRRTERRA